MWLKNQAEYSFVLKSIETLYSSEWIHIFKDEHFWPLYIRTQTIFGKCMRAPSTEVQKLTELYQEGKQKLDNDLLLDEILQKIKKTWKVVVNEYNVSEFKSNTRPSIKEKRDNRTLKSLYSEDSSKKPPPCSPRNIRSLSPDILVSRESPKPIYKSKSPYPRKQGLKPIKVQDGIELQWSRCKRGRQKWKRVIRL